MKAQTKWFDLDLLRSGLCRAGFVVITPQHRTLLTRSQNFIGQTI
jgi:hypothetical protein